MSNPHTPPKRTEPEVELQPDRRRTWLASLFVLLLMLGLAYAVGLMLQVFFRWLEISI